MMMGAVRYSSQVQERADGRVVRTMELWHVSCALPNVASLEERIS